MQVVIDIPEELYTYIRRLEPRRYSDQLIDVLIRKVQGGTPLATEISDETKLVPVMGELK